MHSNMEKTAVPLEPKPGVSVPIPCRHCEKTLIRFTVAEGFTAVHCPRCGSTTEITVYAEGQGYRIKTAKGAVRVKPSAP